MKQINVDSYLCNGCGACVEFCPDVFRINELTDKAELTTYEPEITDEVYQAVNLCPEKCIEIEEIE